MACYCANSQNRNQPQPAIACCCSKSQTDACHCLLLLEQTVHCSPSGETRLMRFCSPESFQFGLGQKNNDLIPMWRIRKFASHFITLSDMLSLTFNCWFHGSCMLKVKSKWFVEHLFQTFSWCSLPVRSICGQTSAYDLWQVTLTQIVALLPSDARLSKKDPLTFRLILAVSWEPSWRSGRHWQFFCQVPGSNLLPWRNATTLWKLSWEDGMGF
jgi:hypothetical protein